MEFALGATLLEVVEPLVLVLEEVGLLVVCFFFGCGGLGVGGLVVPEGSKEKRKVCVNHLKRVDTSQLWFDCTSNLLLLLLPSSRLIALWSSRALALSSWA